MAYETFTWVPLSGPSSTTQFRVLSARFGDGYAQEAADGINNYSTSWPLTFQGQAADITPIITFIKNHAGYKPFEWTPPLESVARLFVVQQYSLQVIAGQCPVYRLTATFEERYASS